MNLQQAIKHHDEMMIRAMNTASNSVVSLVNRHHPINVGYHNAAACEHCYSQCHSYEGLTCDEPDGSWPCPDARDLAALLGVTLPP